MARRKAFIDCFDTLLDREGDAARQATFEAIVGRSSRFMEMNNALMMECKERPWWTTYLLAATAAATALGYWRWFGSGRVAN